MSSLSLFYCRWGPEWTVDSNGGVCRHGEVGRNGCCVSRSLVPPLVSHPLVTLPSDARRSPLSIHSSPSSNNDGADPKPDVEELAKTPGSNLDTKATTSQENAPTTMPTCSEEHQCCAQYEFCVSSCMDFTWRRLRDLPPSSNSNSKSSPLLSIERLLGEHQADDDNVAKEYSDATDLFDWCLLRCRTSGRSVVHQNSFRSTLKYCFGLKDPPLLARNVEKGESE